MEGQEDGQNEKVKEENGNTEEMTEEQKKKMMEIEAFNKLTPEQQKEVLSKRVASKKVRCKNWPNCKDPTCIFSHPTETVSLLIFISYSVLIFLHVHMEINVVISIQVFNVNMDFIVQELIVLILILQVLTLEWLCIQI